MKLSTAGQGLARFAGIGGRDGCIELAQPVKINNAISRQWLFDDDTVKPFNDFGLSFAQRRELQLEVLQQLSGSTKIVLKCTTYSSGTQSVR